MSAKTASTTKKLRQKAQLMSASDMARALARIAHEIVEQNGGVEGLGLIGIRRRGVPMAQRLAKLIEGIQGVPVPVGTLDISFYRDDLSTLGPNPVVRKLEIDLPSQASKIILADDVLFTGRTVHAALDALLSTSHPIRVQLCVLIDRGHRELPIEGTFVGRAVQTAMNEVIEVKFMETDKMEKVLLMEK